MAPGIRGCPPDGPGRFLTARNQLDAKFVEPAVAEISPRPAPPTGPTTTILAPAPRRSPQRSPGEPGPAEPAPPPPVQAVDARADRVWATILLGPGDESGGELKDAQLRGGVMVHQDPAPGKAVGNDASGEALDLFGQGNGLMKFVVASEPPQAVIPKAKLASRVRVRPADHADPGPRRLRGADDRGPADRARPEARLRLGPGAGQLPPDGRPRPARRQGARRRRQAAVVAKPPAPTPVRTGWSSPGPRR